jgi:hypothetical protein
VFDDFSSRKIADLSHTQAQALSVGILEVVQAARKQIQEAQAKANFPELSQAASRQVQEVGKAGI